MIGVRPSGKRSRVSHWTTLVAALALGLPLAIGGCSASFDVHVVPAAPAVSKDELAQVLTDEIVRRTGQRPDLIRCPSDLPRTTGASVSCELIQAGQRMGTVTATINDQGRVRYDYDIAVPTPPATAPGPGK